GTLSCGLLACALLAPRLAAAGAVYRCSGANGQLAFTNKPSGYSGCSKVSDYADAPAPKTAPSKAAPAGKHVDYVPEPAGASSSAGMIAATPAAAEGDDKSIEIHRGAVYKLTRANGVTEYTNVRPMRGAYQLLFTYMSTCYACNLHSTVNWTST